MSILDQNPLTLDFWQDKVTYLNQISQQIGSIETLVKDEQVTNDNLEVIKNTLEVILASLDEISVNQQSTEISNLAAQIKQLNEWLDEYQDSAPSTE